LLFCRCVFGAGGGQRHESCGALVGQAAAQQAARAGQQAARAGQQAARAAQQAGRAVQQPVLL